VGLQVNKEEAASAAAGGTEESDALLPARLVPSLQQR
jgi:hypothetical protein